MSLRAEGAALLTTGPVRFEVEELPNSWILRKYVCTVWGVAHESSFPPKNVLDHTVSACFEYRRDGRYLREVETANVDEIALTELNCLLVNGLNIVKAGQHIVRVSD